MPNYTEERNTLVLLSLMKEHNVRKVIVSPGTTNVAFVASLQQDSFFELYSAYDERSAAYIACGLAAESGEAVALSCTQATASRNYLSGLTEAYYRKLPVLAITSTQHLGRIGQNCQQAIDRGQQPVDTVKLSVHVPAIFTEDDDWYCNVLINRALLELRRNGGSPVHINLMTTYSQIFNVTHLPKCRVIQRVGYANFMCGDIPSISAEARIAIYVGAHKKWSNKEQYAVDLFCEKYGAVVLCDQISNYKGAYRINPCLVEYQQQYDFAVKKMDLLIYIGDVSGAPTSYKPTEVWRVNPDGEIRDLFKKETFVFEMEEIDFFNKYAELKMSIETDEYLLEWKSECTKIESKIPELPFSNAWLAMNTISKLPENSVLHMGIYNSLRHWSFFEAPESVLGYSNTGGFGIDGGLSSAIGATLATDNIVFMIIGDLAFFYDINSLCNRHVKSNLRILLVNNGLGTEFKNPDNRAYRLEKNANQYIAAEGHNGRKSSKLVYHYATDLGFEYMCANSKEEYMTNLEYFISEKKYEKPVVFEVFINYEEETEALRLLMNIETSVNVTAKNAIKSIIGDTGVKKIKKILDK